MSVTTRLSAEVVDKSTLDELAEIVRSEHASAKKCLESTVRHAIQAGTALMEARRLSPYGTWMKWLRATEVAQETANIYMRLAKYQEIVKDAPSINFARMALQGLPDTNNANSAREPWIDTARKLRSSGMSHREIADVVGRTEHTVRNALDPESLKRKRAGTARWKEQQTIAKQAQKQREREALARKAGGGISEAYSLTRKLAQVLDNLGRDGATDEVRVGSIQALRLVHRAEDAIVRALGKT